MQDVGTGAGPAGALDDLGDGLVLGTARAGGQERFVVVAARVRGAVDRVGVLGVDDHEGVEGLELGHVLLHLVRFEVRELVHAGVQQEALEAEDAFVMQAAEVGLVARDGAAPEADVHKRLVLGHLALELEAFHGGGGRDGVQRHVDDGGDAAGGGCPGGGGEALPLGAAGLVDVDVGVHQAGEEGLVVRELDQFARRRGRSRAVRWRRSCRRARPLHGVRCRRW